MSVLDSKKALDRVLAASVIAVMCALGFLVYTARQTNSGVNTIANFSRSTDCRTDQLRSFSQATAEYLAIQSEDRDMPEALAIKERIASAFAQDC